MVAKAHFTWPERSLTAYRLIKAEKKPYEIRFAGKKLLVLPNVVSPKYTADSRLYSKFLPGLIKKSRLLEVGTGTGITSVACALNGAHVVATDINKNAVRNCRINSRRFKVKIDVRKGDVFGPIRNGEKFDYIYWNHPWNYTNKRPGDILMRGAFDYRYNSTSSFIRNAKKFLAPEGSILIGTINVTPIVKRLGRLAKKYGYRMRSIKEIRKHIKDPEEEFTMDLLVLELKPHK